MRRFSALAVAGVCALLAGSALGVSLASGSSARPVFSAPSAVTFDFVSVGATSAAKTVTIGNTGNAALVIKKFEWFGPHPAEFKLVGETCTDGPVAPGASCQVRVTFTPGAEGTRLAVLRTTDNTVCHSFVWFGGSGQKTAAPVMASAATCDNDIANALDTTATQTVTDTQTVPAAPGTSTVKAANVIGLPSSCSSRRKIALHLKAPTGKNFTKVTAKIRSRTVKVLSGKKITATVNLSGLPRGRFTLNITAKLNRASSYKRSKHYVTCVKTQA